MNTTHDVQEFNEMLQEYCTILYGYDSPRIQCLSINTIGICLEVQYNNSITVEDITKESAIDSTALKVLAYSHPHDTCDGY